MEEKGVKYRKGIAKYGREVKSTSKGTYSSLKERWLLTRKTFRYMSDSGKKILPENANLNKKEDIAKVEEQFQRISREEKEFILWDGTKKTEEHSKQEEKMKIKGESLFYKLPFFGNQYSNDGNFSMDDYGLNLPSDIYNQLVRVLGGRSSSQGLSSTFLESDILVEEDEDDGDLIEFDDISIRSIGTQTDPFLDMCVQTDEDIVEDYVNVGTETKEETEATVAYERALMQHERDTKERRSSSVSQATVISARGSLTQQHIEGATLLNFQKKTQLPQEQKSKRAFRIKNQPHQQLPAQESEILPIHQQQSQPPVLKKFWARRESVQAKEIPQTSALHTPPQLIAAGQNLSDETTDKEKPASSKWSILKQSTGIGQKSEQPKQPVEKKKQQNVFKLGLRSDMDATINAQTSSEKSPVDKFKMVNYDKTLRNIKSKWQPSAEEEEYIRYLQRENELERNRVADLKVKEKKKILLKEKEERRQEREKEKAKLKDKFKARTLVKLKEKIKQKTRAIQVGDPLPQFILNSFRINSPVEIIHQTKKRFRRFSSKAESTGSESTFSPDMMHSPRYSICILDSGGNKDLMVSEAEAYKLSQMGIPFLYKKCTLGADDSELDGKESSHPTGVPSRILSAIQASDHITQLLHNLKSSKLSHASSSSSVGKSTERLSQPHISQNYLQNLLSTVMQRSHVYSGSEPSKLISKRIWRNRSKSQSRASAGSTSIWTPMGSNTWMSITGRVISLEPKCAINLSELERLTLQKIALSKLHHMSLGCQVKVPKESTHKKRRSYLIKRKTVRSSGIFDKKEAKSPQKTQVFGLSLSQCLENEKARAKEAAAVRESIALAAAATQTLNEMSGTSSRKSSQTESNSSFSSLIELTKHTMMGSLESLNLERKRPSLESILGISTSAIPNSPELTVADSQPHVPGIVNSCCKFLEKYGLHTLGIFRVSPAKKRVRQLRDEFDSGKEPILTEDQCPHDVAALLKEFFRDQPEPLLTKELYEPLLASQKIRNRKLQLETLQNLILLLPRANRDTLHTLLIFLSIVAENSSYLEGDPTQGNKMDSNNLATVFAPNILHQLKNEPTTTSEMASYNEERTEAINVLRTMIDHSKEIFEVSAELQDETYQNLMDTHPDSLDMILKQKSPTTDEKSHQYMQQLLSDLLEPSGSRFEDTPPLSPTSTHGLEMELDTNSSVFDGSDASSPLLPRSPTDHEAFERLRAVISSDDEAKNTKKHDREFQKRDSKKGTEIEEKGWFRRREKSGSSEWDKAENFGEKNRWFKRKEKTKSDRRESFIHDKLLKCRDSDKKFKFEYEKSPGDANRSNYSRDMLKHDAKSRDRRSSQESVDNEKYLKQFQNEPKLEIPQSTIRRLSSPDVNKFGIAGVITASLKIPVPLQQISSTNKDHNFLEKEKTVLIIKDCVNDTSNSRPRTGSGDSFLGQTISETMTFQPLTKKDTDKMSHDSIVSSSSMGFHTMSPSEQNTPTSEIFRSENSSVCGNFSPPPMWTSPDSGTPGLTPPNSPPSQRRQSKNIEESPIEPAPITHSASHQFHNKPYQTKLTRNRPQVSRLYKSNTSDNVSFQKPEISDKKIPRWGDKSTILDIKGSNKKISSSRWGTKANQNVSSPNENPQKISSSNWGAKENAINVSSSNVQHEKTHFSANKQRQPKTETRNQLWKRWEIIASDSKEPETYA